MKKKQKIPLSDLQSENFAIRGIKTTYNKSKGAVVKHGATGVIALLISSAVPLLEQWHSDVQRKDDIKIVAESVKDVETRLTKQIDDNKKEDSEKIKSLWQSFSKLQDKVDRKK